MSRALLPSEAGVYSFVEKVSVDLTVVQIGSGFVQLCDRDCGPETARNPKKIDLKVSKGAENRMSRPDPDSVPVGWGHFRKSIVRTSFLFSL